MVARSSASLGLSAQRSLQARIFSAVSAVGDATCTSVPRGNRTDTDVEWASEIPVASKTLPSEKVTARSASLPPKAMTSASTPCTMNLCGALPLRSSTCVSAEILVAADRDSDIDVLRGAGGFAPLAGVDDE